jgi:hypothetical protein
MSSILRVTRQFSARKFWLPALTAFVVGFALCVAPPTSANHPVLVEGNCDSPVPGTTLLTVSGTCGDYDGDGRIGTAEDTDGADRIFGTLTAAIGPGTGAAAGTGANFNGRVLIVASGRFAEALTLNVSSGNLQIEAAPGVDADIDAVLQGDPAGGNNIRQEGIGINVAAAAGTTVTLRNLTIRNWAIGVQLQSVSRVYVDNCRIENNRDFGILALNESRLNLNNSQIVSTGRRVGSANNTTTQGHGINFRDLSGGYLTNSAIVNSLRAGILHQSGRGVASFHLVLADNDGGPTSGNAVVPANF